MNETTVPGGSMTTIEHWYTEYHSRLYARALYLVGNHEDAKDVMQSAWLKIWKAMDAYDDVDSLYAWLNRIVSHTAFDFLRMRSTRHALIPTTIERLVESLGIDELLVADPIDGDPLHIVTARESFHVAWEALSEMHQQTFIEECGVDEHPHGPRTSLQKTRLYRARQAWRHVREEVAS